MRSGIMLPSMRVHPTLSAAERANVVNVEFVITAHRWHL